MVPKTAVTPHLNYRAAGFFVLRTPFDPFDTLERWRGSLDGGDAEGALDALVVQLRAQLAATLDRPEVREALLLASRSLVDDLHRWLEDPESDHGRRIEASLIRYVSRMAGRPTPFGIFAGNSVGHIGAATNLRLTARGLYRRVTRPAFGWLLAILETFRGDPRVRERLRYQPNPTLYRIGGRFRYVERRMTSTGFSYYLSSIDASDDIERVLDRSGGGIRVADLLAELASGQEEDSRWPDLIDALISAGILLDDLELLVTGSDPLARVIDRLPSGNATLEHFRAAWALMEKGDAHSIGLPVDFYHSFQRSLPVPPYLRPAEPVLVSLIKPTQGLVLSRSIAGEVIDGVRALHAMDASPAEDEELAEFKTTFLTRYGEARLMPLLRVLDPEAGIGFGFHREIPDRARVLEGLGLGADRRKTGYWTWSERDQHLLRLLEDAWRCNHMELKLGDADVQALTRDPRPALPDTFCAAFALEADSAAEIDKGNFRVYLKAAFGPSGASVLGRQASVDPELQGLLREFLRAEEALRPDAVFAEIVHLPDADAGNVVFRPVLRDHEIPVWGAAGGDPNGWIALADLGVTVRDDRIILYSETLSAEVIPRLTCAHNYKLSHLDVYRFLCTLQHQGVRGITEWSWGPLGRAVFLPRVVFRRLVLARARWRLNAGRARTWRKMDRRARLACFEQWRKESNVPRFVLQVDGDLELPVDTENPLSVEALLSQTGQKQEIILEEMIPGPGRLPVFSPEGRYVHEIMMPFVRTEPTLRVNPRKERFADRARVFSPWSEWMYLKLYTGEHTSDVLLTEVVAPLIRDLKERRLIDRWHFARYADPDLHIRLRLHSLDGSLWGGAGLDETLGRAVRDGFVHRVQIDTYVREIERYGGPDAIELAEAAFEADSESVLAILAMLRSSGSASTFERWKAVAPGIDRLLSDFGWDLESKRSVCERMRRAYLAEFGVSARQRRAMGLRYRTYRDEFEVSLNEQDDEPRSIFIASALRYRSMRFREIAIQFRALEASDNLIRSLEDVVISLAHMHANRMLSGLQREQELVVYDFLCRAYESLHARTDPGATTR